VTTAELIDAEIDSLNEPGLPALCHGPRVRNIHGVDEAVELASVVAGARALTRFVPAFMTK
jgi:acetylornithine deacetylase